MNSMSLEDPLTDGIDHGSDSDMYVSTHPDRTTDASLASKLLSTYNSK